MISDLFWVLISTIKFSFTLFVSAIIKNSLLMTSESLIGAIIAIFVLTFTGVKIKKWVLKNSPIKFRKFTKLNRLTVRMRQKFGIWGIAILTPVLLGYPIGIFLALGMTTHKHHIFKPMVVTTVCYAISAFLIGRIINI